MCGCSFCSLENRCTNIPQRETSHAGVFFCFDTSNPVLPFGFVLLFRTVFNQFARTFGHLPHVVDVKDLRIFAYLRSRSVSQA